MHIPDDLVPITLLFAAHFVGIVVLGWAIWRAPWRQLWNNRLLNLYCGAVVALLLLWSFNASVQPGLGFHFLGVTIFTLMFGWSLGVIGTGLAALGMAVNGSGLPALFLNILLLGVLPVSVSYGIYYWVHRYLPHHVFIYIFLCAFLGSIIAAAITVFAIVGVLVAGNAYPLNRIASEYLPFLPLYLFPEGFLNGMLATVFIGLRPQWLKTFDEHSYLQR